MSFIAHAKTLNVWAPFNCLHARPTECLWKLPGSSQCAVTPIKLLLLAVQQSVVVAMYAVILIASFTCSFITAVALSILRRAVVPDVTVQFGCRSLTRVWNDGCSTRAKGWRPWTIKLRTALSTHCWDTCFVSSSFSCLRFEEDVPASASLLQAAVDGWLYFFSWHPCFLYNRQWITSGK